MTERLVLTQNRERETEFRAPDPRRPEDSTLHPIVHLHDLTPFGMLLAGLGACTALILHAYAEHHGLALDEVEIRLTYDRVAPEKCERCGQTGRYEDRVTEEIALRGKLEEAERRKLLAVAHQCPVQKMLEKETRVDTFLAEEKAQAAA